MIDKNLRKIRSLLGLLLSTLTILSFQNCAPPVESSEQSSTSDGKTSGTSKQNSSSNSNIWGPRNSSGSANGSAGATMLPGGGSTGGSSASSSNSGSSSGSRSGGPVAIGGGTSGGASTGSTDYTFRITQQPQSLNAPEGTRFQIEVVAFGGKTPYSYQWYKDGKAITDGLGVYSIISDEATSYKKEGLYHVVIQDASGKSTQSVVARVTISEPRLGCEMGSYFTYTSTQFDQAYNYIPEYFDGPRGKFLLHRSYDTQNFLYGIDRRFSTLSAYDVPKKLEYLEKTWISCKTTIPRIHNPQYNPGSLFYGYDNSDQWIYKGNIEFECRNKKLKMLTNSCKWEMNPNYVPPEF